jgi:hypothetical protein
MNARRHWLAFAVLGALDTVVLLEFPIAGLLIAALSVAGLALRGPRAPSIAGLLTGVGAMWLALMLRVKVSCDAFNEAAGQSCEAPGIEGWILAGLVILAIGASASVAVVLRSRIR